MRIDPINSALDVLPFRQLLAERVFCGYKEDILSQLPTAILQRMELTLVDKAAEYFNLLLKNEDELTNLVNLLTVNETYFMREQGHFNILTNHIFPEFIKNRKVNEKFKLLSAGCSSGEELYSALIALSLKYGRDILKTVYAEGIDIDSEILKRARKGVFCKNSFRHVDVYFVDAFFTEEKKGEFKIADSFLDAAFFRKDNLANSEFCIDGKWNAIFYRNVSIYFLSTARKKIFRNLSNALKKPGYLFTGIVETNHHNFDELPLKEIDDHYVFTTRKVAVEKISLNTSNFKNDKVNKSSRIKPRLPSFKYIERKISKNTVENKNKPVAIYETIFKKALDLARNRDRQKALKQAQTLFLKRTPTIKDYLLRANILVGIEKLDEGSSDCLCVLEMEEWNREAYLLLGIIGQLKNNISEAIRRFKGAIYIDSTCWLAHFYLAEIFLGLQNLKDAKREYAISEKLLKEPGSSDCGLMIYPLSFSRDQLILFCGRKLEELDKR
jgi:chemotaxis protein methyltransferase CheR